MSLLNNRYWTIQFASGTYAAMALAYWNTFVPLYTTNENQLYVTDASGIPHPVGEPRIELAATVANTTASIPAGYCIADVFMRETANHAVTGGIRIGTSAGGTQIVASIAVGALSFTRTLPGTLTTSGPFSATVAQTIYIETVTAWNSASVNIIIPLKKAT